MKRCHFETNAQNVKNVLKSIFGEVRVKCLPSNLKDDLEKFDLSEDVARAMWKVVVYWKEDSIPLSIGHIVGTMGLDDKSYNVYFPNSNTVMDTPIGCILGVFYCGENNNI